MSKKGYLLTAVVALPAALLAVAHATQLQAPAANSMDMPGMQMPAQEQTEPSRPQAPSGYATVRIAPDVQQRIGVQLGNVEQAPLIRSIRTVGIVRPDETRIAHIHVKTEGWVDKLYVAYVGQKVKAGQPLFSIYSPALFAGQREYLSALQTARSDPAASDADRKLVADSARQRLKLWNVPEQSIEALERTGSPGQSLVLSSPIFGTVMEKTIFTGQYVMPQSDLYVVADLSTVWVQAKVFEYEVPLVEPGMQAVVTFASLPTQQFVGKVAFVDPVVDEMSRSVQVRIELPNSDNQIRPGMFANIAMDRSMGSGLTIPTSAVIRTGERNLAFRAVDDDRFEPVAVRINPDRFGDRYEVIDGLQAGDRVVTSANFLVDSESRLEGGASGGMAGMPGMGGSASSASQSGAAGGMKGMAVPDRAAQSSASPPKP